VLDGGAGSGRSALMVLQARPRARVVAMDIFDNGYGIGDNTPERLMANARTAGVADRLEARTGDLRDMPFADGVFDAAVSAYAIDHLRRDGITKSLDEMHRVIRQDGDFLLFVMSADAWVEVAFPLFPEHGMFGPGPQADVWRDRLVKAGFEVLEIGRQPGTLYLLARRV
jgi:ubiquinone/menaquinone biosynthesis C-methylase UbiE